MYLQDGFKVLGVDGLLVVEFADLVGLVGKPDDEF
jgi:hypothetical protein